MKIKKYIKKSGGPQYYCTDKKCHLTLDEILYYLKSGEDIEALNFDLHEMLLSIIKKNEIEWFNAVTNKPSYCIAQSNINQKIIEILKNGSFTRTINKLELNIQPCN